MKEKREEEAVVEGWKEKRKVGRGGEGGGWWNREDEQYEATEEWRKQKVWGGKRRRREGEERSGEEKRDHLLLPSGFWLSDHTNSCRSLKQSPINMTPLYLTSPPFISYLHLSSLHPSLHARHLLVSHTINWLQQHLSPLQPNAYRSTQSQHSH